jgi:hypothetical protein
VQGVESEEELAMKIVGNAAAFLFAIVLMGGLILAQRDYQNSWRAETAIQTRLANAGNPAPGQAAAYRVVMK